MKTRDRDRDDIEPDLVRAYLDEIATVPLLTAEQEVDLAKRIEAGLYAAELLHGRAPERVSASRADLEAIARDGARAKEHMIRANLRLVVAAAKKRRHSGLGLLDLIQEGNLGLIHAVEKFDYTKGYKFSTYAMWWIRQAMQRGEADSARTIRLPHKVLDELSRLNRHERALVLRLHREPTDEELAEAAELPVERVTELRQAARTTVSLDTPVGEDGDTSLGDLIGEVRPDPDADERAAVISHVHEMLATLPPIEGRILAFRHGLHDGHRHTLQETAAHVGLDREQVRRLEQQALDRLRRSPDAPRAA
ncbi:MAG TPA: sigma-70 family RNA polymerase sigma factor [Pseudonocardia sp.]|jgi:RNA polymerase sigma factor (sigma-70 family)|uniref:sigma-70 family RNA polymerase sigma factor n=1 Tax=Pseudonocardia sp. TaxID=60912 RepID=UPI002B4B1655|nr:sigma-70 family RNA polymerase sigma factor [Pseudonocardia sp.]HLU55929.1 sigma-70 family RNA polymerase sigma factor [Pseudonocardia sp.]